MRSGIKRDGQRGCLNIVRPGALGALSSSTSTRRQSCVGWSRLTKTFPSRVSSNCRCRTLLVALSLCFRQIQRYESIFLPGTLVSLRHDDLLGRSKIYGHHEDIVDHPTGQRRQSSRGARQLSLSILAIDSETMQGH